ncbi:S8 family serine peptidase [Haloglycomyces albus]|uniref:S8 family serine peptidase n=1 Tax=Haloglycomyces albus TaxID=526067 RepID=UPI00046CDDF5|nr:S8 family serine peptidase [Haloglycomyces albus]
MIYGSFGLARWPVRCLVLLIAMAMLVIWSSRAGAQTEAFEDGNRWVVDQINADEAWDTTQGEGITVAIIDDGIAAHPVFEGMDIRDGVDSTAPERSAHSRASYHGTALAGALVAVAPKVTILPIAVWAPEEIAPGMKPNRNSRAFADAIYYAVEEGADVINISSGLSGGPREREQMALQYAMDQGVVVVAAGGNDPDAAVGDPAREPGVVVVSGTGRNGDSWSSSTTGPEVVVAAPADYRPCLLTQSAEERPDWAPEATEEDLYEDCQGTSYAAPAVAGAAALVKASDPSLTGNDIIQRLIDTASGVDGSRSDELGYGVVDVQAAIESDISGVESNPLGYPLGEQGASEEYAAEALADNRLVDTPEADDTAPESDSGSEGEESAGAESEADSGQSLGLLIGAAGLVVLGGVIVTVVLVRQQRRKRTSPGPVGTGGAQNPFGPQ